MSDTLRAEPKDINIYIENIEDRKVRNILKEVFSENAFAEGFFSKIYERTQVLKEYQLESLRTHFSNITRLPFGFIILFSRSSESTSFSGGKRIGFGFMDYTVGDGFMEYAKANFDYSILKGNVDIYPTPYHTHREITIEAEGKYAVILKLMAYLRY